MKLQVSNKIRLVEPPASLADEVKQALTFANPQFQEAQQHGRWTGNIPRNLCAYEEDTSGLEVPRGFGRHLLVMARYHQVPLDIEDWTRALPEVSFSFKGTLRPFQEEAVASVLSRPLGTLSAPTGSGKTVMAVAVIAERRQPALVVVHTKELLYQWIDRIEAFLGVPAEEVGIIGAGRKDVGERITVGIVNSIYKCADEVSRHIGHLIVDECHRTPSRTFTEAVSAFDARYLLGLSATPWRRDKLSRLIYWHLGDVVHKIEPETLQESGDIVRAEVVWRETAFRTNLDASEEYSRVLSELTKDPARNRQITRDVAALLQSQVGTSVPNPSTETCTTAEAAKYAGESRNAGVVLVLSDRKNHVRTLAGLLEARGVPTACLTGKMNTKARAEALEAITGGKSRVLLATGQLIGEGFDLPAMSALFLATPIRFDGRVLQYIGRVLRPAPGKDKSRVHDYVDVNVGPLKASARARGRVYESHGMEVKNHAGPGLYSVES